MRYLAYFRARESQVATPGWAVAKTLTQMAVSWTLFFGVIPFAIRTVENQLGLPVVRLPGPAHPVVGVVLFACGGALGLTSSMVMAVRGGGTPMPTDCAPRMVVAGPYRFVRNPMAIGGIAQGGAVGLIFGSPTVLLGAALAGPIWNWGVRPWEERDLERRFGDPYRAYRQAVRCWIPRLRPYHN